MPYKIEERSFQDAPSLTRADIMTMTEAADFLGMSIYNLRNMLDRGDLRAVIDDRTKTPTGTPKRYVLRSEVEELRKQRDAGDA